MLTSNIPPGDDDDHHDHEDGDREPDQDETGSAASRIVWPSSLAMTRQHLKVNVLLFCREYNPTVIEKYKKVKAFHITVFK